MREFFRGWRRKAGCVTLVMACVVMGGWGRSMVILDEVTLFGRPFKQSMASMEGVVTWSRFEPGTGIGKIRVVWESKEITPMQRNEIRRHKDVDWKWQCCGFVFGASTTRLTWRKYGITTVTTENYWQAPYWSVVIPLLCLSAYMLLTKPRKSTLKKLTEPISDEEATS